jgi:nitrogen fixation/metabolism regulation signal transduction histidine kinase
MVRESLVKFLANPFVLRGIVVLICGGTAFLMGMLFIRLLRRNIAEESDISSEGTPSLENLPLHLYNTVIQQLKQQKHELHVQSQAEQRRAQVTESFSQAVLSNLSMGVLVFGANGLVKTSNPAAKEILGFASTTGMSAEDIFRQSTVRDRMASPTEKNGAGVESGLLADEIEAVLHQGSQRRQTHVAYQTPAGQMRFLSVTISPVPGADGTLLGVACLINDLSELEKIRRQQELQGELSAERALELRSSLATIAGYAQQLAANRDPEIAQQLAADIAEESLRLDRSIGGFLTERPGLAKGAGASGINR